MRLTDLEPAWLTPDLFIFKNPTGRGFWLTCKRAVMSSDEQYNIVEAHPDYEAHQVVPCKPSCVWKFVGSDFNTMTVTPSLNANASGNWHGYITKGMIVGGLK